MAAYQVGEPVQGRARQRQTGGVDKAIRTLDGVVVFLHTKLNCRRGSAGYASAPTFGNDQSVHFPLRHWHDAFFGSITDVVKAVLVLHRAST
ncbi:hypothetical protein ACIREM_37485 [Streptomyces shenzhenensis]|uniref:hypothetical protein n=1 Tax=Streptomyces shenzhenensis TaxID=943815 RepID=UPI003815EAC8